MKSRAQEVLEKFRNRPWPSVESPWPNAQAEMVIEKEREMRLCELISAIEQDTRDADSRTAEIREYLRQCELNAEDNIEGTTANEFLEWNAVAGALHDILREFDRRWPK